jgi:hypothetical protein
MESSILINYFTDECVEVAFVLWYIKGLLNICTLFLVHSQIWLYLPMDDRTFFYIFQRMTTTLDTNRNSSKKKKKKKRLVYSLHPQIQ